MVAETNGTGASPSLENIAQQIQDLTTSLTSLLKQHDLPQPSFDANGLADVPRGIDELEKARSQLVEKTRLLHDLVMGPSDYLRGITNYYVDVACIHWIYRFKIAEHVPLNGSIPYAELAAAAKVSQAQLCSILRYAMTCRLFYEPSPGTVAHTSVSRLLRDSPPVVDYVGHCVEFTAPLVGKLVEASERFQGSGEPNETAFNIAYNTPLPLFPWMGQHPETAQRFKRLMMSMTASEKYSPRFLAECYDWASVGEGTVVDVGGSAGHCSMAISKAYPKLKFVVQDLPHVVAANKDALPSEFQSQISFLPHDFFAPQPVKDADIYLFSQIFHDWSDKYVVKILQATLKSMKPGAKIVIRDQVMPSPGTLPSWVDKEMRMVDIVMMTHFNAKEREIGDWEKVLAMADERLKITKRVKPDASVFSIMEVQLQDS